MYTVSIYADKMANQPVEVHDVHPKGEDTIERWLRVNVQNYAQRSVPLYSATVNDELVPPWHWATYTLKPGDRLAFTVEPKEISTWVYVVITLLSTAYSLYVANQIPDNYQKSQPSGTSIYNANAQGNQVKLMGVIAEVAGKFVRFPDIITAPFREYVANSEWVHMLLCLGVGDYQVTDLKIGQTPVGHYAGDIIYQLFEPGDDVSGNIAHKHIYTTPEVGRTSSGSMEISYDQQNLEQGWTYDLSGFEMTSYHNNVLTGFPFSQGEYFLDEKKSVYEVMEVSGTIGETATVQLLTFTIWEGFDPPQQGVPKVLKATGSGWLGPYVAAPLKENTSTIWLDFKLPRGLGRYNNDGDLISHTVQVEVQYRAVDTTSWTTITYSYEDRTADQLGFTERIDLTTPILPEVRVRRVGYDPNDQKYLDTVEWVRLKCELTAATHYTDVTTMAIAIRGTNAIGSAAENKINSTLQRLLPSTADYAAGQLTNRSAQASAIPFFIHATQDAGYPLTSIDLAHLEELDNIAWQRGDTFNGEFSEETTLYAVQKRALATLYAEPVIDYGKISAVREEVTDSLGHLYTPNVIKAPGVQRSVSFYDADEHDGVLVEYFDIETNKPATVECLLTVAGDQFIKPQKVRAFGITDRTRAWRYGMRIRRKAFYKPLQYRFKTEMDALNSAYGSIAAITDDLIGGAQAGEVLAYDASQRLLTVDTELEFDGGQKYIAVRRPDGTTNGLFVATPAAEPNQCILNTPLDFTPVFDGAMERPYFGFGGSDTWALKTIVRSIKPSGADDVQVVCEEYLPAIYADDDNTPEN